MGETFYFFQHCMCFGGSFCYLSEGPFEGGKPLRDYILRSQKCCKSWIPIVKYLVVLHGDPAYGFG